MTPVVLCKCGLRFETKGLAAGTRRRCPMCSRELVVPAGTSRPPGRSRVGWRTVVGGSLAMVLVAGGGVAIAAYLGAFPSNSNSSPSTSVAAVATQVATTTPPVANRFQPTSTSTSLSGSDLNILPLSPIGSGPSSDSPLIPPR